MRTLDTLIDRAILALPRHLHDRVVVFGSAPMVLAGLKPDVRNDLDMFVSAETFAELKGAGFQCDEQRPDVPRIILAQGVDVFRTWLGVAFPEVYAESAVQDGSHGLRVATLQHVLKSKLMSSRDKDHADIALLQAFFAKNQPVTQDLRRQGMPSCWRLPAASARASLGTTAVHRMVCSSCQRELPCLTSVSVRAAEQAAGVRQEVQRDVTRRTTSG
jgi:hypothetical protein